MRVKNWLVKTHNTLKSKPLIKSEAEICKEKAQSITLI